MWRGGRGSLMVLEVGNMIGNGNVPGMDMMNGLERGRGMHLSTEMVFARGVEIWMWI